MKITKKETKFGITVYIDPYINPNAEEMTEHIGIQIRRMPDGQFGTARIKMWDKDSKTPFQMEQFASAALEAAKIARQFDEL